MPTYDFHCPGCEITEEEFVRDVNAEVLCHQCECPMERKFPAPRLNGLQKFASSEFRGFREQMGFEPRTVREIDDYCKQNGKRLMDKGDVRMRQDKPDHSDLSVDKIMKSINKAGGK